MYWSLFTWGTKAAKRTLLPHTDDESASHSKNMKAADCRDTQRNDSFFDSFSLRDMLTLTLKQCNVFLKDLAPVSACFMKDMPLK